jgi:tRNA-specific 2-thiouridylase
MKIAVLVSGGVDSAVSLSILKGQGYEVTAYYIKIWNPEYDLDNNQCPWKEDTDYVEKLCSKLNVEFKIINMQLEYQFTVMEYMISELKKGKTPNPDIFCNYYIKFGLFYDYIDLTNFDYVASGHYATKRKRNDDFMYWHKADPVKDQTFFLSKLKKETIKKIIFPLSGMSKTQVRELASKLDLPQKDKKDSQGLCFIGDINYNQFISKYISNSEGNIYNAIDGKLIGKHKGLHLYTEGQRRGIDLPNGPWYVMCKNTKENSLSVVNRLDFHLFKTNEFQFSDISLHNEDVNSNLYLKIRHPQPTLIKLKKVEHVKTIYDKSFEYKTFETEFEYYPWNFSPGQIGCLYEKDDFGYKAVGTLKI